MHDRRQFLGDAATLLVGLTAPAAADEPAKAAVKVTPEARKAAEAGLKYLAEHQEKDGAFGSDKLKGNTAASSLGALALMAGGHTPDGRGAYKAQVLRTV